VIDLAATVLDVAGLPQPTFVHGIQQRPLEGVSMAYSFDDPAAADRHTLQYFEMFGNRGIYHEGWTAVTRHSTPWLPTEEKVAFDDDVWELYDTNVDWSQAHDLSSERPDKLAELQRLFLIEAVKHHVVPLDDRSVERFNSDLAGRPALVTGSSQTLFGGMGRLGENCVLNTKNKSHSITAEVVVPEGGAEGVIVAQGGLFGGWSLYLLGGVPTYHYNALQLARWTVAGTEPLPAGTHQVRMELAYDGGGMAKGGDVTLFVDGTQVGAGRLDATVPLIFSGDETLDVGADLASPVSPDYEAADSAFTGTVRWVQLDIDAAAADEDHLISPEQRMRLAMARQ
jgi:hypothetical protein